MICPGFSSVNKERIASIDGRRIATKLAPLRALIILEVTWNGPPLLFPLDTCIKQTSKTN